MEGELFSRVFPRSEKITIWIDGVSLEVRRGITIRRALETAGITFGAFPGDGEIFAPCGVGGCFSCSVIVDGMPVRSCVTEVRDGMDIKTKPAEDFIPLRIVHGPEPHTVGGKATPWWLKSKGSYIEVAIWTAGCNLSCPQCQNYAVTYDGQSPPLTPEKAAKLITLARQRYGVDRMAISGGEPTLNRP